MRDYKKDREYRRKKFKEEWKPAYDAWIQHYPFTIESLDGEIWLPIPYCTDYHLSNYGRAKSFKKDEPFIMKPLLYWNGRLRLCLWKNNKPKDFQVHVLVARLFIPNPLNKPEVNHIDGHPMNCYVGNLEWATHAENEAHAAAMGLAPSGEDHYRAKLTNEQIQYIRENPDGLNLEQLAEKFGVIFQTISNIQLGKTYKNAGGTIREKQKGRIPDEIREEIRVRYRAGGISIRALAKEFGYGTRTIWKIVNEK